MELRELQVARLPGLDGPFTLALPPGVTVIHGPNGSGKSSITRAILGLLFDEAPVDPSTDVTAIVARGAARWQVARLGTAPPVWRPITGEPAPSLPRGLHAAAYRLGLLDLHRPSPGRDDDAFARAVLSRLAGGYDLPAVRALEDFKVPARARSAQDAWKAAQDDVRRRRQDLDRLAGQEARLGELEARIAAARDARRRLQALDLADRLVARRAEAAAAGRAAAEFPPAVALLRDQEHDLVAGLARRRDEAHEMLAAAEDAVRRAQEARDGAGLPRPVDPADVARANALARELADRRRERELARRDLDAAHGQLAARQRQLDARWQIEGLRPCSPQEIAEALDLVRRQAADTAQDEALSAMLDDPDLAEPAAPAETAPLEDAIARLSGWLAVADDARRPSLAWLGAGLAVAGATLGWWLAGGDAAWGLGGAVVAAVLLAGVLLAAALASRRARRDEVRRQVDLASSWPAAVVPPTDWTRAEVEHRLRNLARELAAALFDQRRAGWRRRLAARRERLAAARQDGQARGRELARRCGLGAEATAGEAHELLRRVADYHAALAAVQAAQTRLEAEDHAVAREFADLAAVLRTHDLTPPDDARDAASAADDLRDRAQRHRRACDDLERAQGAIARARAAVEIADGEWAEAYARLGLAPGDEAALQRLCDRLAPWRRAASDREVAAAQLRQAEADAAAAADPAAVAALAVVTDQERRDARERAQREEEDGKQAHDERVAILDRVATARRATEFEAALARREAAAVRARRENDQARDAALAQLLLDEVEQEQDTVHLPAVLDHATAYLARFTGGRYRLRVHRRQGGAAFVAEDTATGRPLALDELSDGTRAQLLLAARLAFVVEGEGDEPLPLLLDQALAATDPERFAAVAGALADEHRTRGRQILVLTADPADAAAWQRELSPSGAAVHVVDLAAVRAGAEAAPLAHLVPPEPRAIPAPAPGEAAAAYARRLNVPPLDVHRPATAAHLYYLLADDLPELHRQLERGGVTWGAAAALAAAPGAPALPAPLAARAAALAAFLAARRVGRGPRLARTTLLACEALARSTFEDRVVELCEQVGGDAARLLARLSSLKGIRSKLRDDLEEFLRGEGYLAVEPPRTRDELMAEVVAAVGRHGPAAGLDGPALRRWVDFWWQATAGVSPDPAS